MQAEGQFAYCSNVASIGWSSIHMDNQVDVLLVFNSIEIHYNMLWQALSHKALWFVCSGLWSMIAIGFFTVAAGECHLHNTYEHTCHCSLRLPSLVRMYS